jgi:hypothetical protein
MLRMGFGRPFDQRTLEELVKAETKPGPRGEPPRRSSMWRRAIVAFTIVSVLMLLVLVTDCADGQPGPEGPASSPAVTATTATES